MYVTSYPFSFVRRLPDMKQSPYLDMLRAVAAFWVLCAHCLIWSDNGVFAPDPKLAVDVFMILSGVLMARTARPGVWRFYVRRFLRIAPAYYAALALAVLCAPWFLGGYQALYDAHPLGATYNPARTTYTLPNLAIHASLLFGVLPRYSFATMLPDWSLSLEWQFYLACPALLWLWRRRLLPPPPSTVRCWRFQFFTRPRSPRPWSAWLACF